MMRLSFFNCQFNTRFRKNEIGGIQRLFSVKRFPEADLFWMLPFVCFSADSLHLRQKPFGFCFFLFNDIIRQHSFTNIDKIDFIKDFLFVKNGTMGRRQFTKRIMSSL